jgi:hypothetical protein
MLKFSKLDIERDRNWYEKLYCSSSSPYADLSFGNCFIWFDLYNDLEYMRYKNFVLLRYTSAFSKTKTHTLWGSGSIENLYLFLKKIYRFHPHMLFEEIPQNIIDIIGDNERFNITEERDGFEYILSASEHAMLEGRKYSRQRNQIQFFKKSIDSGNISARVIKNLSKSQKKEIYSNIQSWGVTIKSLRNNKNNVEQLAIKNTLKYFTEINQSILIIYLNNQPISYVFFRNICDNFVNVNHLKVNYSIKYVFDYSIHLLSKELYKENILYINFEQDLGLQGLRRHKHLLRPIKIMKKYSFIFSAGG